MGETIADGTTAFIGGQNAGILPDRIEPQQYARGVNLTTRDGGLGPRAGFVHQDIKVITEGYETIFRAGKFQGAHPYIADNGQFVIVVISGVIFQIDPERKTAEVLEIERESTSSYIDESFSPATERLDQYCARHPMSDAGRYLVVYDYPDLPVIIEGSNARRSNPERINADGEPVPEIPTSVRGAYNNNRLFITNQVHEFTAGDPVGSLTAPDAPITFQEIFIPAAPYLGQSFSLGSTNTNNPITALGFIQVPDTSTGVGPLFIATRDAVYTFRTDLPRSSWEQVQFGSLLLFNSGIAGGKAFTNINSDLIYMGGDGQVRSLHAARQEQSRWSNNPIDRELGDYVRFDDKELNELTVVSSIGNKVFVTVNPYSLFAQDSDGVPVVDHAFRGLAVLELDNVSAMLRATNPVWAGIWTGINPTDMVVLDNEMYIFAKDRNGQNDMYLMDPSITYDVYAEERVPVVSRLYTRQYNFEDPFSLKEEKNIQLSLSNLSGDVKLTVDRKIEGATKFTRWTEWEHNAPTGVKDAGCGDLPNLSPHTLRELFLGDPEEHDCSGINRDDFRYFRKSQYRFTIQAENWNISELRVIAEREPDDMRKSDMCDPSKEVQVEADCSDIPDWDLYHLAPNDRRVECPA